MMNGYIHVLKSKIHRAVVTQAKLDYVGSITVDQDLLEAAGIHVYEKVLITNMRNGSRIETYVLAGRRGSGVICMNGPCAHFFYKGDEILIMAFKMIHEGDLLTFEPKVIFPANANKSFTKGNLHHHIVEEEEGFE
jgi:aspartate 1-decarboxylase